MLDFYENDLPEYDDFMFLRGFTPEQIMQALRKTNRKKKKKKQGRQQSILEQETMKFIEANLRAAVEAAMDEIMGDFGD